VEKKMTVYTDPNAFIQESRNKFLLRINSKECKVLIEALKSFDKIDAKNKPSTASLEKAINEIDNALLNKPVSAPIETNGYEAPVECDPCQD
jgi:hypothetical protein